MRSGQIMWICENEQYGVFANCSLARLRRDCIAKAEEGSGHTWAQIKACGWKPVKVRVTIEKIEK